jgi:SAM-dependent methyltransferase
MSARAGEVPGTGDQRGAQYRYHRELFPALHDWERTERSITGFTGEEGPGGLLGLDQMGHLGPQGCDLVAEAVAGAVPRAGGTGAAGSAGVRGGHGVAGGAPGPVAGALELCELGSGFGGALRYTVDRLTARGLVVRRAYGVDLVAEHCAVSRRISRAQGRETLTELCASATAVPLPDASLDVVMVTGSMPHFPAPGEVLQEAGRLLRPGGVFVATEEVSLTPDGREPSARFRAAHPEGIFFTTPLARRLRQFEEAGLGRVERRDLGTWAAGLLAERLKVLRIFRGSVTGIYGEEPVDLIVRTLTAAREEYAAGRLLPVLFTARRAADS